jgi:hypothetical protein
MDSLTAKELVTALVSTKGSISFHLDYRINGRRETVTFRKYGPTGLSLARAKSCARNGACWKLKGFGEKWLVSAAMTDSTRAMRRSIFERELVPTWRKRLPSEINPDDLSARSSRS